MGIRRVSVWLMVGIVIVALPLALMYIFQRSLIYMPFGGLSPVTQALPGAEDVSFVTADGLELGAWYLPAADNLAPVALLFNGNAGNREIRAPLAQRLHALGLGVLMVDYRGYGGNPGSPTEAGLYEDARAALTWLREREDVDPDRLVYVGESLGSGVAVALAVEHEPAALVLRSPFTSLVDAAKAHFGFLPIGLLLKDRFVSVERIERVRCPVAVVAGEPDSVVPTELSRRLFAAANEPKHLFIYPGFDHNDAELSRGELWVDDVAAFLREAGDIP